MKKFSIKKRVGFMMAGVCTGVVLLFTIGIGFLISNNTAEAAMCDGNGCSYFTIKKELVDRNGQVDIPSESEFRYKITISSNQQISAPVEVYDMLGPNIQYQRVEAVDFGGGFGAQPVTTGMNGTTNLQIIFPNGIQKDQEITIMVLAKTTQPSSVTATTVNSTAYVYSNGDSQCKTRELAQNYGYDNCSSSISFSIVSVQLQIDKTIDGNYETYENLHTGEEFMYTLKVTNNALGTYARDTITVYDEISPYLSNVRVVKILYFNKLIEGLDDNNNLVNADPPYCTVSSQTMKCVFNSLLYDETTSGNQIIIQVAATPSAQYEISQDPDAYTINNEAFVYSQSDSYCKTLSNAQEELDPSNETYIGIADGKGGLRNRCRSAIEFNVVQPELGISKEVSGDGRVWCEYKDSGWNGETILYDDNGNVTYDPADHIKNKDISAEADKAAACVNEYASLRPPNEEETWTAFQEAVAEGKVGEGLIYPNYTAFAAAYKSNTANYVTQASTPGVITDNSVHNGETLVYTLAITNTGSGDTKGDVIVTDQLDKNAFSDSGISVQPLTGGVDCTVKDRLVKCTISRVLSNKSDNGANVIYIRIAATIENAGTIYNSAYVGGGGDLKCPISSNGTMWCKSNEVSTYVTSPELHINKELRIDSKDCPSSGDSAIDPNDADACWSLGTAIVDGSWAKYVIKVTNEGTANTSGLIVIHDQIPEYLEVDRTTLSLKFDDGAYSYTAGLCEFRGTSNRDLYCRAYDTMEGGLQAKNGSWTIEFNVRVMQDIDITKDNNKVINYAYVYGGGDVVCKNETVELSVQQAFKSGTTSIYDRCYDYLGSTIVSPKLNVTKSVSSGQVQAGQPFKYTISVDNIGDYDMPFGTTVVDVLPADITIDTTSLPSGCEYNDGSRRITCLVNEKISKNQPKTFELTALSTNATGTITNKVLAYNKHDKDCQTELSAGYTSRCHDTAVATSMAPVLKVNMYTNTLDSYVGGQVEYRIVVSNIGNMATTETTTINQAIPSGLRILGVRAQKGVCWPSATEIKCELPAGIKAGETVNISVLTQVTSEGDISSEVNLYDGGDTTCAVDGTTQSTSALLFSTPVFAADDTPNDVDDNGSSETTNGSSETDEIVDETVNETGDSLPTTLTTSDSVGQTATNRNSRCYDNVAIVAYASPEGTVLGINDTGIGSPTAGALSLLQAVGTISLLGAASYGLLKFGFVASPVK